VTAVARIRYNIGWALCRSGRIEIDKKEAGGESLATSQLRSK
jgi:hypothetical protein